MNIMKRYDQRRSFTVDHVGLLLGVFLIGLTVGLWGLAYHSETLMADRLEACGYTSHPIADVAWEMVRRGQIPVATAAYESARLNSRNSHPELKACMSEFYSTEKG